MLREDHLPRFCISLLAFVLRWLAFLGLLIVMVGLMARSRSICIT